MRIRRRVRRLRSAEETLDWAAQDLAFEVVALASLGLQQLFFPCFELPLEGLLAIQELLEFFLWLHGDLPPLNRSS